MILARPILALSYSFFPFFFWRLQQSLARSPACCNRSNTSHCHPRLYLSCLYPNIVQFHWRSTTIINYWLGNLLLSETDTFCTHLAIRIKPLYVQFQRSSKVSGTTWNNTAQRISSDGLSCPFASYSATSASNLSIPLLKVLIVALGGLRNFRSNLILVGLLWGSCVPQSRLHASNPHFFLQLNTMPSAVLW